MTRYKYRQLINPLRLPLDNLKVGYQETGRCYWSIAYQELAYSPYALYISRFFPEDIANQILLACSNTGVDVIANRNISQIQLGQVKDTRNIYHMAISKVEEQVELLPSWLEVPVIERWHFHIEGESKRISLLNRRAFVEHFYGINKPAYWTWARNKHPRLLAYKKMRNISRTSWDRSIMDSIWMEGLTVHIPASNQLEIAIAEQQASNDYNYQQVVKAKLNTVWNVPLNFDILDKPIQEAITSGSLVEDDSLKDAYLVLDTIGDPALDYELNAQSVNQIDRALSSEYDRVYVGGHVWQKDADMVPVRGTLSNRNFLHRNILASIKSAKSKYLYSHRVKDKLISFINPDQFVKDCNVVANLMKILDPEHQDSQYLGLTDNTYSFGTRWFIENYRLQVMEKHQDQILSDSNTIDLNQIKLLDLSFTQLLRRLIFGEEQTLNQQVDHYLYGGQATISVRQHIPGIANADDIMLDNHQVEAEQWSKEDRLLIEEDPEWQEQVFISSHEMRLTDDTLMQEGGLNNKYRRMTPDNTAQSRLTNDQIRPIFETQYKIDQLAFRLMPTDWKAKAQQVSRASYFDKQPLISELSGLSIPDETHRIVYKSDTYYTNLKNASHRIIAALKSGHKGYWPSRSQ